MHPYQSLMHPYHGDTLIIIDIQAENKAEIIPVVQESFEYMPGWMIGGAALNAKAEYPEERIFIFNLTLHTFDWWRDNTTFSDTMDKDEVVIKDLADISYLLEFIYENTERLREKEDLNAAFVSQEFFWSDWQEPEPPKKRKKEAPIYPKDFVNENDDAGTEETPLISKFQGQVIEAGKNIFLKTHPKFNPMEFIKIEERPFPKANMLYKDFKDLSDKVAEEWSPPKFFYPDDKGMDY